jgi:hypothetical protein
MDLDVTFNSSAGVRAIRLLFLNCFCPSLFSWERSIESPFASASWHLSHSAKVGFHVLFVWKSCDNVGLLDRSTIAYVPVLPLKRGFRKLRSNTRPPSRKG